MDRKQNVHKLILLLKVVECEERRVISAFCRNLLKNAGFFMFLSLSTAAEVRHTFDYIRMCKEDNTPSFLLLSSGMSCERLPK